MNVGRCYINVILETEMNVRDWRCYINVILETEWMLEDVILMLY